MTTAVANHVELSKTPLAEFRNEPVRDFSRAAVREDFRNAIAKLRERFPLDAPLVIDGKPVRTKEVIAVRSPNDTSLVVGESGSAGIEDTDRTIAAAKNAFASWSQTDAGDRAAFLLKAAEVCRQRRDELSALMVHEAAKPWREADADTCEAIDFLEYYAREALRLGERRPLQRHVLGERNELYYQALGVVGVIGPWNFPMAIPVGMMAAAVAAGNTVVWKPAEQTPLIAHLVMKIMEDCGLPRGVVNYLPGRGEVCGQRLLESTDVQMIAFTGSREVGLHILKECNTVRPGQRFVKRVVAEMGGKNALIVDSSADLDSVIPDVLYSAYGFSGQKCSACSRLIVVEDVYDELLPRLREGVASLKIAPSTDPGCQVNAVIDEDAKAKVLEYIAIGREEGTELYVAEVGELAEKGHFVPPAVFTDVAPDARLAQEEVFGPVLAVIKARDFDHALEIANGTDYALTGGVHSRTLEHLEAAKTRLQCGNLYLNRTITGAIVGRQPFGGFRMSGIGSKAGGPDYLKQFLVARSATENLMRHGFAPLDEGDGPRDEHFD
ncbi:MAG: L-glutamate gamma-semialdehyde dehydrogenase [Sumerlaeia bacterium]